MASSGALRYAALASLGLTLGTGLGGAAACTGSAPPPPPLEIPPHAVFSRLYTRAPAAVVALPLTLDTKSCAFARYNAEPEDDPDDPLPLPFVLIHPLRTQCELWLGRTGFVFEYCLYPRDPLVEIDASLQHVFRVLDDEHCTFGTDPPPDPPDPA